MRQVFSRWPSLAQVSSASGVALNELPSWMTAAPQPRWPFVLRDTASAAALVAAPATSGAAATLLVLSGYGLAGVALGLVAFILTVLAVLHIAQGMSRLRRSEQRGDQIFERAGISMWREDWTAAGEAVIALRRAGVSDIESYFASRPDDLRALKARVMVRDVNSFTLEETGAPSKEAYIGPLDRLLPDTDQTFVQWLVAFGRGDRFFRSEAHITTAEGAEIDSLFTAMLPSDLGGFAEIVVTSVDVTAYKRSQARLASAEADAVKSSLLSTANAVSASIAHEVNSPLAAILANAQAAQRLLRAPTPDIAEATSALKDVVSEATRAKDVVAKTTSYFSNSIPEFASVDVIKAAREANMLVEKQIRGMGAVVHLSALEDVQLALADLIQIQQVLVNLLLNAAQAMTGREGKRDITLVIRSERDAIAVDIFDTGPGIEPGRRAEVFEPFHSTKPGGMGMGLAICRNCIDAHGGNIWVDAAPGGGAAFHFTLPAADE